MKEIQLLQLVMERLTKQFNVPATFTHKVIDQKEGIIDVHIFLHGEIISYFGSLDGLFSHTSSKYEEHRKINMISDYLIDFFIKGIKENDEMDAMDEVQLNLDYLYEHNTKAVRWTDKKTDETKVTFVVSQGELMISLCATQLRKEYEERYNSEESPDILVDLANIITLFKDNGIEEAKKYADKLKRNIQVKGSDLAFTLFLEDEKLKELLCF